MFFALAAIAVPPAEIPNVLATPLLRSNGNLVPMNLGILPPNYYISGALIDPTTVFKFDYELSLAEDRFYEVPEYLEIDIVNKTGDPALYTLMFIEKRYDDIYNIDNPTVNIVLGSQGNLQAWVCIPFMTEEDALDTVAENERAGKIYLQENLKATYEFTPGAYRLVIPLLDGKTHYLEFWILEEEQ